MKQPENYRDAWVELQTLNKIMQQTISQQEMEIYRLKDELERLKMQLSEVRGCSY